MSSCSSRFDLDENFFRPETNYTTVFVKTCQEESPAPEKRQTSQPFQIVFSCTADTATCDKARAGFVRAGGYIQAALKITQPVVVKATFRSFCGGSNQCSLRNTLGQASAAAFIPGADGYLYAQALYKQLSQRSVQYANQDIVAEFNSDFNFWFKDDTTPIRSDQVDFDLVVTHELVHGLGFTSSWNSWFTDAYPIEKSQSYLTPSLVVRSQIGANQQDMNNLMFGNWQPLQSFDRAMRDADGKSLVDNYNRVTKYSTPGVPLPQFVTNFKASGDPFTAAQEVYNLATGGPRNLVSAINQDALFSSGQTAYLQTYAGRWLPGSSIAHMDLQTYVSSPDFLMIPDVTNLTGQTLQSILARLSNGWKYGVMGPNLLGILNSMGWPLVATGTDPTTPTASPTTVNPTSTAVPTMVVPPTSEPATIGGMTIPIFVAVIAGSVLGAALLIGLTVCLVKRSRRKKEAKGVYMAESLPFEQASTGFTSTDYSRQLEMGYNTSPRPSIVVPVSVASISRSYNPQLPTSQASISRSAMPTSQASISRSAMPTSQASISRSYNPPQPYGMDPNDFFNSSYSTTSNAAYAAAPMVSGRNTFSSPQIEADAALARMLQEQEDALARGQTPRTYYPSAPIIPPSPAATRGRTYGSSSGLAAPLPPPGATGTSTNPSRSSYNSRSYLN